MLQINDRADPYVSIPLHKPGLYVTVDALQNIDHDILAAAADLILDEFESIIRRWSENDGLPYHVVLN